MLGSKTYESQLNIVLPIFTPVISWNLNLNINLVMTLQEIYTELMHCRYEAGKWRHIQKDTEFGPILKNRSNVDLKDKWRNLNMDSGGSRRDSRGGGDKVISAYCPCLSHL